MAFKLIFVHVLPECDCVVALESDCRDGDDWGQFMTLQLRVRGAAATLIIAASLTVGVSALAGDGQLRGWHATIDQVGAKQQPRQETAEDLYSDAQMYIGLREWAAADRLLRAVISRFPQSATAAYAKRDIAKLRREVFGLSARSALGGPIAPPSRPAANNPQSIVPPWSFLGVQANLQDQFRNTVGDRLFFAAFSSALGTRNLETLKAQAKWLADRAEARVVLEAHADEPGGAIDHAGVAKSRAETVKAAFVREGVAIDRISIVVFGRSKRVALCETAACRAQNRRVVVRVSDDAVGRPVTRP